MPCDTPLSRQFEEFGLPLEGEWVDSEGKSFRLNRYGTSGWLLTTFAEKSAEEPGGENTYLVQDDIKFYGHHGVSKMHYKVYWGYEVQSCEIKRIASRFVGFDNAQ